jgi:hypothetical protein
MAKIEVSIEDFKADASATQRRNLLMDIANQQLRFWEEQGAVIRSGSLPIYIQPESSTTKQEYFSHYLGANWIEQLKPYLKLLQERDLPRSDLFEITRSLDLTLPPFFSGEFHSLEFLKTLSKTEANSAREGIVKRLDRILVSHESSVNWRGQNISAAYYEYRGLDSLGLISLNQKTKPNEKNAWEYDEVLAHEIGHLLHYMQWEKQGVFPNDFALQDTTTNELIADFFGHIFLATDGCHRRRTSHQPWEEECTRTLNPEQTFTSIESEILNGFDGHDGGLVARKFLWNSYLKNGRQAFSKAFVLAVQGIESFLRAKNFGRFTKEEYFMDPFLFELMSNRWQHQTLSRLLVLYCDAIIDSDCDRLPELIKDDVLSNRLESTQDFAPVSLARKQQIISIKTDNGNIWGLKFLFKPRDELTPPKLSFVLISPNGVSENTSDYTFSGSYREKFCLSIEFSKSKMRIKYCDDGIVKFE